MNSNEREKPEQMPGSQDTGETVAVISEQGGISGQKKEVNVENYERVASIEQVLKDLEFPMNKEKVVEFVKTNATDKELLQKIEKLPNKEYKNYPKYT